MTLGILLLVALVLAAWLMVIAYIQDDNDVGASAVAVGIVGWCLGIASGIVLICGG